MHIKQCYMSIYLHVDLHFQTNQRTNGPVKAHLISWPSKAQNIQNLENIRGGIKKFVH